MVPFSRVRTEHMQEQQALHSHQNEPWIVQRLETEKGAT